VVEVVLGHQLVDGVQVAFVDCLVEPADERLVIFGWHDYLPLLLRMAAVGGGP